MKYYLVNAYELQNSAMVNIDRYSDDPVKLNKGKSDNQVIISSELLVEMGKFAWIES